MDTIIKKCVHDTAIIPYVSMRDYWYSCDSVSLTCREFFLKILPLNIHITLNLKISSDLEFHIQDLALKVFISIRHIIHSVHKEPVCREDVFSVSDSLKDFSPSDDIKQLNSLISIVERKNSDKNSIADSHFMRQFSFYCDSLCVYKNSITQNEYYGKIFPWKLLSFFYVCKSKFREMNLELYNATESKLINAVLYDQNFLQNIFNLECIQEKTLFLQVEYYKNLVKVYFLKQNPEEGFSGFRLFKSFNEKGIINQAVNRPFAKSNEKIQAAKQAWQKYAVNFELKGASENDDSSIKIKNIIDCFKKESKQLMRRIDQGFSSSKIIEIVPILESFFEYVNLKTLLDLSNKIQKTSAKRDREGLIRLLYLLSESLSMSIQDQVLNVRRAKNIRLLRGAIKRIRNYFAHPEGYFLNVGQKINKEQKRDQLFNNCLEEIEGLVGLVRERFQLIEKLLKTHPQKEPEELLNALRKRELSKDKTQADRIDVNYPKTTELSEKIIDRTSLSLRVQYLDRQFISQVLEKHKSRLRKFEKLIKALKERWYFDLGSNSREVFQNNLLITIYNSGENELNKYVDKAHSPKNVVRVDSDLCLSTKESNFEELRKLCETKIQILRGKTSFLKRKEFKNKVLEDIHFRFVIENEIGEFYSALEKLIKLYDERNFQIEQIQYFFSYVKDARNYQTHDLWRFDANRLVNVAYMICGTYSYLFDIILDSQKYQMTTQEKDLVQKGIWEQFPTSCLKSTLKGCWFKLNARDYKKRTFLHLLSDKPSASSFEKAKYLIEEGMNIHVADWAGRTALHYACGSGFQELVELLIEKGAVADSPSKEGTPLEICQQTEHLELAQYIEEYSSTTRKSGAQALLNAVKNADLVTVEQLLMHGHSPTLDFQGTLPLVELFRK